MSDEKIYHNKAIDAALQLDGNPLNINQFYYECAKSYTLDLNS